ncbi:MAG: hypothetical protein JXX14_18655 [Deltaproteobacteria bacterium]|nr:hypothetical protein [Deltaproteobacteria bacterium]
MYRTLLCLVISVSFSATALAQTDNSNSGFQFGASGSVGKQDSSRLSASENATPDTAPAANTSASTQPPAGQYTYEGLLAIGHGKYVVQDFAGASAQYENARLKDPARPEAYYFIGCTLRAQGQYQEAVSMLASAATVAGDDDPVMNARALFVIATVWESARNFEKAKYAWIQYKAFAQSHSDAHPFIQIADAHIAAIDAHTQLVNQYEAVTARIAANRE